MDNRKLWRTLTKDSNNDDDDNDDDDFHHTNYCFRGAEDT